MAAAADPTIQAQLKEWASSQLAATRVGDPVGGRAQFLLPLSSADSGGGTRNDGDSGGGGGGHTKRGLHSHPQPRHTFNGAVPPLPEHSSATQAGISHSYSHSHPQIESGGHDSGSGNSSDSSGRGRWRDDCCAGNNAGAVDSSGGPSRAQTNPSDLSLAEVYRRVEAAKGDLGIVSFSLTQPTLAQVFMNVVGKSHEPEN